MPADALATLGASASAGMVLTPKGWIFCLQHQKSLKAQLYHLHFILICHRGMAMSKYSVLKNLNSLRMDSQSNSGLLGFSSTSIRTKSGTFSSSSSSSTTSPTGPVKSFRVLENIDSITEWKHTDHVSSLYHGNPYTIEAISYWDIQSIPPHLVILVPSSVAEAATVGRSGNNADVNDSD